MDRPVLTGFHLRAESASPGAMIERTTAALGLILALSACGGKPAPTETPEPTAVPTASADPIPTATVEPTASASAAPVAPPAPTPAVVWKDLVTPESVYFDEANDRYLVSNINGKPLDADGNGFISVLAPDGKTTNLKWIEGSAKLKLDAPKGMAIVKNVLYVADITRVRMFDAKSGAAKGEVVIEGATFLNDVAAAPDGRIFVSDSGLKQGASDFEPTNTDAVFVIEKGKAKALAKSTDLKRPNGLWFSDKGLLVNTFGGAELFRLDDKGAKQDVMTLPNGGLDGLVPAGDGWLVSSWAASTVYRGKLGGSFEPVLQSLKAPADIGFDKKRNRVLVPRFLDNVVEAYDLK